MPPYFYILMTAFLFGLASAYAAHQRKRNVAGWFVLGISFGIFALIWVLLLPPLKPPEFEVNISIVYPNPLSLKEWFYLDHSRSPVGPLTFADFKQAYGSGAFGQASYVWCEGMEEWQKAETIEGLEKLLND